MRACVRVCMFTRVSMADQFLEQPRHVRHAQQTLSPQPRGKPVTRRIRPVTPESVLALRAVERDASAEERIARQPRALSAQAPA